MRLHVFVEAAEVVSVWVLQLAHHQNVFVEYAIDSIPTISFKDTLPMSLVFNEVTAVLVTIFVLQEAISFPQHPWHT